MSAKSCECTPCTPSVHLFKAGRFPLGFFLFSFLSFYIFLLLFTLLTFHLFILPQKSEIEVALNERFLPYSNIAFVDFCSGSFNKNANMKISHWKTAVGLYLVQCANSLLCNSPNGFIFSHLLINCTTRAAERWGKNSSRNRLYGERGNINWKQVQGIHRQLL